MKELTVYYASGRTETRYSRDARAVEKEAFKELARDKVERVTVRNTTYTLQGGKRL